MRRWLVCLFVMGLSWSVVSAQEQKPCGTAVLQRHRPWQQMARSRAADDVEIPRVYQGEKRGLVILMSFPNQSFSCENPKEVWQDILNLQGYHEYNAPGSASDYFYDQSYGQFQLVFDVVGPIEAKHPYAYYGKDKRWQKGDEFDQNDGEFIEEACRAAADSVRFADYDWNDDGEVDLVYVIYAGYGEADYWRKDKDVIWPHMGILSVDWVDTYPDAITLQGIRIDFYGCSNELTVKDKLTGIGTICHEISHILGLPDLYNTVTSTSVLWYDDLMDSGNYNEEGWCPPGFSSYELYACGWLTPDTIADPRSLLAVPDSVSPLAPLHEAPDVRIWRETEESSEYYLIEYRKKASWDHSLTSHGLIAWRIDYDAEAWRDNLVNIDATHYRVWKMAVGDMPTAILRPLSGQEQTPVVVYDLHGRRYPSVPDVPGLYIVRYSDGTTKKVFR